MLSRTPLWLLGLALPSAAAAAILMYFYWRRGDEREEDRVRRRYSSMAAKAKLATVVSSTEELRRQWPEFERAARELGGCGLDCEWRWRTELGSAGQLALMQLAAGNGRMLLIRVQKLSEVPQELEDFLADSRVLKFGVGIDGDAAKILDGIGVRTRGLVDLRGLLRLRRIPTRRQGLKALSAQLLGLDYSSLKAMAKTDWEAPSLSSRQVEYAAMDALVGVLLALEAARRCEWPGDLRGFCEGVVDVEHRGAASSSASEAPARGSAVTSGLSARTNPLYHNCQMLAPDNQLMCTLDQRRAEWYVAKQLAVVVTEQPCYTIRLLFEPRQRPDRDEQMYYLADKVNQCVVCGSTKRLMRRKIVPDEYRRHFPEFLKSRKSHDIVLLCTQCHVACERHTEALKRKLAAEFSVPLNQRLQEDRPLRRAKSNAKALLANAEGKSKIPQERLNQLESELKEFLEVEELTHELLKSVMNSGSNAQSGESHGAAVVKAALDQCRILEFEEMWRKNFLETMQPQFMPDHWSTSHMHDLLKPSVDQFLSERQANAGQ